MMRFIAAFFLSVLCSSTAQAWTADSGRFAALEFVADTRIAAPDGTQLSLCHQVDETRIFGYAVSRTIRGYVLSSDGCIGQVDRAFSTQQMETAQSLNLIDASLPSAPRDTAQRTLQAYGIWVAICLALFAVIWRRMKSPTVSNARRAAVANSVKPELIQAVGQSGLVQVFGDDP